LAHLTGATVDVVTGNLAGAPGEEWCAAQVTAREGRTVEELMSEWEAAGPRWDQLARDATHPSFIVRNPYLDTGAHEADLYGALGLDRPPAELTLAMVDTMVPRVAEDFEDLGLFTLTTPDRTYKLGEGDLVASAHVETYELSRAVLGRRSQAQIEAWNWTGAPGQFTTRLPVFQQVAQDLVD
jgi:hypothetical protein